MKFLSLILCSLFSISVFAGVCSETTKVCVDYKADADFTTKQEGRFALSIQSNGEEATLVKTDLWMQMGSHGHGSSPLKVTPVAPGEYDVAKAYFVMKGTWQIRVTYKQGSVQETLIIPVMIKE